MKYFIEEISQHGTLIRRSEVAVNTLRGAKIMAHRQRSYDYSTINIYSDAEFKKKLCTRNLTQSRQWREWENAY